MTDIDLRTVKLTFPKNKDRTSTRTENNTWVSMLEQLLSCNYEDYTVTIQTDPTYGKTFIEITFASVDDAVWFKMCKIDY